MSKKNKKKDFNSKMMKKLGGNFILWILIIVISVTLLQYLTVNNRHSEITYSQFNDIYKEQHENIEKLIIEGKIVKGSCFESSPCIDKNSNDIIKFSVTLPELTNELVDEWILLGMNVEIKNIENPRKELEEHYYNPKNIGLLELGLEPIYLSNEELMKMMQHIIKHRERINNHKIFRGSKWA